ncbi:Microtubule-associated protein 1A [Dissostichus eleginoides]|uniref:Microtubule-associated protein 1A n=1 Tax=Dissostichus eleginoides TaxID=100907 RepID=A0AAD9F0M3_DISEL|nr:Microtubule-associated protein 1A [Dissostichus eleginoides]
MDRRTNQNQRGNPRPFDHGAVADRAYRQIHCRNGWIYGLDEFHMALGEERAGFGHRMRKEKDNVKRLEDILSNRNSGFDQDNKRLFDIIQYRVADISRLKEQMEAAESQHKQQLDDMVAQQQKLSDQNNEGNLVTFNLLQRREQELLQCEEKFTKNLAEKHDIWENEKLQMEKKYEEVTQEKNDLDRKILSRDTEFQQLEANTQTGEQQKNYLAKKNKSCETDVKQLKDQMREQEEMFSKDLAQNQESWEAKVNLVEIKLKEVTQEKDDLAQKQLSSERN